MAKKALVQSDQMFRTLIENHPDAISLIKPDGTILYANAATARLTGYAPEQLPGMNSLALLHPGDRVGVAEQVAEFVTTGGESLTQEYRLRNKYGTWHWIERTMSNLLANPQVGALLCTERDIAQRKNPLLKKKLLEESREFLNREGGQVLRGAERSRGEKSFQDVELTFRSLVESSVIGVMVTDPEGRIHEVNAHLADLLRYSQEELLSGSICVKDLLVPVHFPARSRAWKTLGSQGSSLPEEKEFRRKDGSIFPALVTAATINPERTRALVMLLDISERRDADRRKEEYLSMVSHELRTPLTIIQGFLELALFCVDRISAVATLEAHDFLNKLESMLQQAQQQTELETRLVADLVDVSRIEMQKFAVSLQLGNLSPLVQQIVDNQRQVATTHQIELILPSQDVVWVVMDAERIDQVLSNYLTNAFKYAPANQSVRVELSIENGMARVSVSDQGPGLSEEEQQHVWERFYQTENVMQQGGERGLGLGLYIVRTIIAQHQGQVGVDSDAGQGATFWFMLPLADESA